ncbi:hypothetical protein Tco_0463158 [Tanacetum coccineum]
MRMGTNNKVRMEEMGMEVTEEMGIEKMKMEIEMGIMILHDVVVTTPKGLLWTSSPKSLEAWIYLPSCGKLLCLKIFFILSLIFKQNILEMSRFGLVTLM